MKIKTLLKSRFRCRLPAPAKPNPGPAENPPTRTRKICQQIGVTHCRTGSMGPWTHFQLVCFCARKQMVEIKVQKSINCCFFFWYTAILEKLFSLGSFTYHNFSRYSLVGDYYWPNSDFFRFSLYSLKRSKDVFVMFNSFSKASLGL